MQPLKMELTQGSETLANYNLMLGKYPKEHIQLRNILLKSDTFPLGHSVYCINSLTKNAGISLKPVKELPCKFVLHSLLHFQ